MWGVKPSKLCSQHLLGEHVEMHMFVGTLNKGSSVTGYLEKGLVELDKIRDRHDELVVEMKNRGMEHQSPLPEYQLREVVCIKPVDSIANEKELSSRCIACRKRMT